MLRAKPVLSYIGNPKPTVFNCEFSGYPPPDVRIIKDGQVLARSKESLSYSVTVDSVDDLVNTSVRLKTKLTRLQKIIPLKLYLQVLYVPL